MAHLAPGVCAHGGMLLCHCQWVIRNWKVALCMRGVGRRCFQISGQVIDQPLLFYTPSLVNSQLLAHCPGLSDPFVTDTWIANQHVQTIMAAIPWSTALPTYKTHTVQLADGGELLLHEDNDSDTSSETPILIIFPGITGHCYRYATQCMEY